VALGLLGPVGSALMILVMIVAMVTSHWKNGFFAMSNGIELTALYVAGALALALAGPGAYSLDALLGLEFLWTPMVAWVAVALAVVGAIANLAVRRPSPAPAPAAN
jgi:putative oxidoreductase